MKILLFIAAICFAGMSSTASPGPLNSMQVANPAILPDLSQDVEFINTVIKVYSLQSRILETNSAGLIQRAESGTLSKAEEESLAVNLGFVDYRALNNSFNSIGISVLALKNKYSGMNEVMITTTIINAAIGKLADEGRIQFTGKSNACLCALYNAIYTCFKTSADCTQIGICVRAAYAQYAACKTQEPPR